MGNVMVWVLSMRDMDTFRQRRIEKHRKKEKRRLNALLEQIRREVLPEEVGEDGMLEQNRIVERSSDN